MDTTLHDPPLPKIKYATEREAIIALNEHPPPRKKVGLGYYQCECCGLFHIGRGRGYIHPET